MHDRFRDIEADPTLMRSLPSDVLPVATLPRRDDAAERPPLPPVAEA